ncbi:MAG: MG284/MPN403 family protein [Erysipelotrichaceae bacterium]
MTEFKMMVQQVSQIVDDYNLNRFKSHVLKDSDVDEKYALKVEYAFSCLNIEEKRIFDNDFLNKQQPKYWWRNYYSKSTYYRLKYKAMKTFLHCFKS